MFTHQNLRYFAITDKRHVHRVAYSNQPEVALVGFLQMKSSSVLFITITIN